MTSYAVIGASRGIGLEYVRQLVSLLYFSVVPVCVTYRESIGRQTQRDRLCGRAKRTTFYPPPSRDRWVEERSCPRSRRGRL